LFNELLTTGLQTEIAGLARTDFMGQAFKPEVFSTAFDPADMAAQVMTFAPATDAEALKLLRARFPDQSLRMRVAALDFLMRRHPRKPAKAYSPR